MINQFKDKTIILIPMLVVLISITSGFVISTESNTILFLFLGLFSGGLLLMYPLICFWLVFVFVFFIGFFISFFPQITTIRWSIVILSLLFGVRGIAPLLTGKTGLRGDSKPIFFLFILLIIGILTSMINGISISQITISIKNYFQFLPIAFGIIYLPQFFKKDELETIIKGLVAVAFIQVPIALFQKFYIVPILISQGNSSIAVVDSINGSFGTSIKGGASDTLSLYLIFIIGLLLSFYKHKLIKLKTTVFLSLVLTIPTLINETKMSLVYFLVIFFVIFQKELLKKPSKGMAVIISLGIIFFGFIYTYKSIYITQNYGAKRYMQNTLDYNFGAKGYGRYKLNRLTSLTFWVTQQKYFDPLSFLLGHGLDSTNEGEAGIGKTGHMAARYLGYGIGLTLLSKLLWETGVLGLLCFIAVLFSAYNKTRGALKRVDLSDKHAAVLLGLKPILILFFVNLFVNAAIRDIAVYNYLFYIVISLTILMTQKKIN